VPAYAQLAGSPPGSDRKALNPYRQRMTSNLEARLSRYSPTALGVFRVVFGLLWLCHGLSKVIGWPVGPATAVGRWPDFYAGWIELVTGVLITAGLFTRIAAFFAAGEMAFAYFTVHLPHGFLPLVNHGEEAVMFCFAFLLLMFIGPGAYALDNRRAAAGAGWRSRRSQSVSRAGAPWSSWWRSRRARFEGSRLR
jgi:putative oxidoreductase